MQSPYRGGPRVYPRPVDGSDAATEIAKIDEMWHTFILFTRDYADFCERHFGLFVHHAPTPTEDEPVSAQPGDVRRRLERQFGLIYDVLGEETLIAWYEDRRHSKFLPGEI